MDLRISYRVAKTTRGSTLILVLIFCALIGILTHAAMNSAILQIKMANNFKLKILKHQQLLSDLLLSEKQLANNFTLKLPLGVSLVQFVPDTLHFNEQLGVNYYRMVLNRVEDIGVHSELKTTYAVRSLATEEQNAHIIKLNNGTLEFFLNDFSIAFIEPHSAKIVKEIFFATAMSNPTFTVIDSATKGIADAIYINDGKGKLWKINLRGDPKFWDLSCRYAADKIMGSPLIGRHPNREGILIYLFVQDYQSKINQIQVLWEQSDKLPIPFFSLTDNFLPSQLLLRHGRLMAVSTNENTCHIHVYNAFNGKFVDTQIINTHFLPKDLSGLIRLEVMLKKPLEEESMLKIDFGEEVAYCKMELDFTFLGRRTWEEKQWIASTLRVSQSE